MDKASAKQSAIAAILASLLTVGVSMTVTGQAAKPSVELGNVRLFGCTVKTEAKEGADGYKLAASEVKGTCIEVCGRSIVPGTDSKLDAKGASIPADPTIVEQGCESDSIPIDMAAVSESFQTAALQWWATRKGVK